MTALLDYMNMYMEKALLVRDFSRHCTISRSRVDLAALVLRV